MTKLKAIVFQMNQSHCSSPKKKKKTTLDNNTKALFTENLPLPVFYFFFFFYF